MKIILLLAFILIKTICQQIAELPQNQSSNLNFVTSNPKKGSAPTSKTCTSNQTTIASDAVKSCDQMDIYLTASCIKKYILNNLNQRWNVFVRLNQNNDLPAYLIYDNCDIILRNKGKFNRTFIMWPAISYPSPASVNNALGKAEAPSTNPAEISIPSQCLASKLDAVKASFIYCDSKNSNTDAAICIKQKLMSDLGQDWNAWVSQRWSVTSFWLYDSCALFIPFYGTQSRSFSAWKASAL